jgi:hypothetical protein
MYSTNINKTNNHLAPQTSTHKKPMDNDFPRIKRLPEYVFAITNKLKVEARARGEDIIDFGMGLNIKNYGCTWWDWSCAKLSIR